MCGLNLGFIWPICQVVTALFKGSLKNNNLFQDVLPPPVIHVQGFFNWRGHGKVQVRKLYYFPLKCEVASIATTQKLSAEK